MCPQIQSWPPPILIPCLAVCNYVTLLTQGYRIWNSLDGVVKLRCNDKLMLYTFCCSLTDATFPSSDTSAALNIRAGMLYRRRYSPFG